MRQKVKKSVSIKPERQKNVLSSGCYFRTPEGLTAGRGRVVLGLGGLRACEGVRGRVRACFTLIQKLGTF